MAAISSTVVSSIVVIAIVSLPFVVGLFLHPITRRLAFRHPRRRAWETGLVVLGSLLGTGIITGSLIVGDTIDRSIRASAYDQLGPIDELVSVSGLAEGAELVDRLGSVELLPDDVIVRGDGDDTGVFDGVLPIVHTNVSVVGERTQPRAQLLEVDFATAATFGGDPATTGITGSTPGPGQAVITADVAANAVADVGDRITVHVYGRPVELLVTDVLDRTGVAGFWTVDGRQQSYNVFVQPGSLARGLAGVELPPTVEPPTTYLAFSNVGGVEGGADRTDDAVAALAAIDPDLTVQAVKEEVLRNAEEGARALSQLYFTMGMFAVAAGVLLLVNIFVMLADERRSQLGMLRALGMRRFSLVSAFATEGWIYALVSSAIGAVLGIELGRVIAWRADQILGSGDDIFSLDLTFSYETSTVLQGFAIGLAIAVVTIVLTSIRISRLNVIAAIRDIPTPKVGGRGRRLRRSIGGTLTLLGIAWSIGSFAGREQYGIAMGPMLATLGVALFTSDWAGRRVTVTWSSVLVLAWGTAFIPVLGALDVVGDIQTFLVQGLTMCTAAVALLMVHHKALGHWLSERSGGSVPVRVGLAYPVAKGFRTAMSLGMFAIVILTIVYLSFISLMFNNQASRITEDLSGDFGVIVTMNPSAPASVDELTATEGVESIAPLAYLWADFEFAGTTGTWPITGFGDELLAGPPHLIDRGDFESEAAAWSAVRDDPELIIVDEFFLTDSGPSSTIPVVGDRIDIADPVTGATRSTTVAALATADWVGSGAYYGIDGFDEVFGDRAVASRFYVSGDDLPAIADDIGRRFVANGAEARPVRETVDGLLAQNNGFFVLMQQFVGVGLLVGIAGLGVVMVRSVRERRREVGVLRAIGFERRPVTRSFLLEATFIAVEGVVIGIAVAFIGTYGLVLNNSGFAEGFEWSVPWRDVAFVAGLTLVAAVVTAMIPARQAGGIRPAQALRTFD